MRYLSNTELAPLNSWPPEQDAVTFFTLTDDDRAWLAGFNRDDNRLGVAVQLCTVLWLGWIPEQLTGRPAGTLARLVSGRVIEPGTAAALLAGYADGNDELAACIAPRSSPGWAGDEVGG